MVAEDNPVVVLHYWASWDPTSRALGTRLRQMGDDYPNLRFYAVDIDQQQNWPLAIQWGVMTTPTLVCIFKGVFYELLVGLRSEPQLRAKLAAWNNLGVA